MNIRKQIDKNIFSYFAFCIIAVFIYVKSFDMTKSSAMFPRLLSIFIFILNIFLIIHYLYRLAKRNTQITIHNEKKKNISINFLNLKKHTLYPILAFIISCLFVYAYPRIGFEISAFFLVFSIMFIIDRKEALKKFYYALLIPLIFLLIFKLGLNLDIPLSIGIF